MLELLEVTKSYGNQVVLHPTSLTVREGTTTVLIGPSGCGKSTLLRIMIGMITPDAGTVRFRGEAVAPENVLALRRRMGYVLQDGGLFPHLTAFENAALLARHLGRDATWIHTRIEELADLVRLPANSLQRYPSQLSGGQRQRVGIVRALMLDPPVVLLDEPLGALDPLVRYDLQNDLRAIFRTVRKAVVLVTHDMGEAAFFGDDVILLGGGRVVQRGTIRDMLERPASEYVTRFLQAQRLVHETEVSVTQPSAAKGTA